MNKSLIAGAVIAAALLVFGLTASADILGVVTSDNSPVCADSDFFSSNMTEIDTLNEGDNITILNELGDWCRISYNGGTALIRTTDVTTDSKAIEQYNRPLIMDSFLIKYAESFVGVPYVYGGSTPSGFDCSGFVGHVYSHFGIDLPRVTYGQMTCGKAVNTDELEEGDLLFFRGGGHVGIYVGDGMYIHAPQTGRTVSVDPLTRSVYAARRLYEF